MIQQIVTGKSFCDFFSYNLKLTAGLLNHNSLCVDVNYL